MLQQPNPPAPVPRQAPQPPAPTQPPRLQAPRNAQDMGKNAGAYLRQEDCKAAAKGQSQGGAQRKGNGGLGKVCKDGYVAGRGKGTTKKSREPPVPEAPVDCAGEWVLREKFRGQKSFGFYSCGCGRKWTTAHGYKEYSQGCKGCEATCLPYYMWQNDTNAERRERTSRDESDGPHDFERCEACRRGVCSAVRAR